MSDEGRYYVKQYSPYTDSTFWVHYAFGDLANHGNGYELWMTNEAIREQWPALSVRAIRKARQQLVDDGFLETIESSSYRGHAASYRFIFADVPPNSAKAWGRPKMLNLEPVKGRDSDTLFEQEGSRFCPERVAKARNAPITNQKNLSGELDFLDPLRGFPEFWSVYPKRNGKRLHRAKCEALWKDIKDIQIRRAAYRGALNYGEAVEQGCTIARDPDRWLRDKDWTDWQEPAQRDRPPDRGVTVPEVPNWNQAG